MRGPADRDAAADVAPEDPSAAPIILSGSRALVASGRGGVSDFVLPAWSIAAIISVGMVLRGFDSTVGQALSCMLDTALLAVFLLVVPPRRGFWHAASSVLILILAAIGWAVVVTLRPDGTLPDYAVGKLLSLVAGLAAFLAGALATRDRLLRHALIDWLLIIGCAVLLAGLIVRQAGADGPFGYWTIERDGRFTGLIGNSNVTAAIAASLAILSFARLAWASAAPIWAGGGRAGPIVYLPMFVLCVGAVILAASRFTTLILLLMIGGVVADQLIRRAGRRINRQLATAAAILVVLLFVTEFAGLLRGRFAVLSAGGEDRLATWSHLLGVLAHSPTFGFGLGSFPQVNAHFLTTPRFAQADWSLNSPHDLMLQWLLEAGWPYALLLTAAVGRGMFQIVRAFRGEWRQSNIAIALMVALIFACSLVDVVLDMPATVTFAVFLAGLLWGQALDKSEVLVAAPRRDPTRHERLVSGGAAYDRKH